MRQFTASSSPAAIGTSSATSTSVAAGRLMRRELYHSSKQPPRSPQDQMLQRSLDPNTSDLDIPSRNIGAIIWSHNHFDHIGDPSSFSASTDLVLGPGIGTTPWSGYFSNPEAGVLDSDAAGRVVQEIQFKMGL